MSLELGVAALQNNNNPNSKLGILQSQINNLASNGIAVRVTDIILDENHPNFNNLGKWNSIGTIAWDPISKTGLVNEANSFQNVAKPLNPQSSYYPLINEIVILFQLPTRQNMSKASSTPDYYYLSVVNIWNTAEHNAYPDLSLPTNKNSSNKTSEEIEEGSTIKTRPNDNSISLNSFGGTFIEKGNILPILPYAGDHIIQGRFGNTIRLGNTARTSGSLKNNWSNSGEGGSPITIIKNGQAPNQTQEFEPYVENINNDPSSIYLTTSQLIPISSSFQAFPSLNTPPTTLGSYNNSQIILKSNRLSFISTQDIIVESNGQTTINSINDVGIYSKDGNVNLLGTNIRLGDISAKQSLVLGDAFFEDFKVLMNKISNLCNSLSSEPKLSISKAPANSLKLTADRMKSVGDYLSKISKTL